MKRLMMLMLILAMLAVTVPQVSAASSQTTAMVPPPPNGTQAVATQSVEAPKRKGFFAKLWELEKRKNAAILRMLGLRD